MSANFRIIDFWKKSNLPEVWLYIAFGAVKGVFGTFYKFLDWTLKFADVKSLD